MDDLLIVSLPVIRELPELSADLYENCDLSRQSSEDAFSSSCDQPARHLFHRESTAHVKKESTLTHSPPRMYMASTRATTAPMKETS